MKKISLAPRRLLLVVALAVILIAAAVPAVLAGVLLVDERDYGGDFIITGATIDRAVNTLYIADISHYNNIKWVYYRGEPLLKHYEMLNNNPSYQMPVTLKIDSTVVGTGTASYNVMYDVAGKPSECQFWIDIDTFDSKTYTGGHVLTIEPQSGILFNGVTCGARSLGFPGSEHPICFYSYVSSSKMGELIGYHMYSGEFYWENIVNIDSKNIEIIRNTANGTFESTLTVVSGINTFTESGIQDISFPYITSGEWTVVNPNGREYSGVLDVPADEPDTSQVNIYVKASQTGALLADAHVLISASVDNEFHEVINRTLPSGTYSGALQPTGGGKPNPDYYRLITTVEGYNSIMPHIDFEVDGTTTIYAYLDPIAGGPVNENKTFIDFFVRDMSANPVSGATVKFGKYTLITNSAGYTVFEVDKNNNYSWTVSKSGYGSLTGNAVIGSNPRYTINTGIDPVVTPTKPTSIPTSTPISPTPTMTAPTGETVSNWLEWFAAHFGMILGGGVEIGKIFMWLCFTVPVGVYVGKEAKAGAAGFMAGAGIVSLFFVLIGWVPIWLLVLLALIIGLLYAKEFNTSDNGGGR